MNIPAPKNGMRPVHPGDVLRKEFLKPLGMSANTLAKPLRQRGYRRAPGALLRR